MKHTIMVYQDPSTYILKGIRTNITVLALRIIFGDYVSKVGK